MNGTASFRSPLEQMERAAAAPLPEIDAFLPLWAKHLEKDSSPEGECDRDRWLREAALRLDGVSGLERTARKTKKPEALRAWGKALTDGDDWVEALRAYEVAAELVGESHWRGEFLDGAALAVQQLERRGRAKRLEGILGNKRRRHYGHAATLVAFCLEVSPGIGKKKSIANWVAGVRKEYSRFYAFQGELDEALASISS